MSAFFNVEWREILKMCVEIGILAYVIYKILYFVRGARGSSVLAGVVVLNIVLSLLAKALDLAVINWLLEGFWAIIGLAVVVIFQPELRRAFAQLGTFSVWQGRKRREVVGEIVQAVQDMARRKCGALIVLEKRIGLQNYIDDAIKLDIKIHAMMLESIFFPNSPLHDGAVIIRDDRIVAARVILPLTRAENISRRLGTRHRAALGISEETDAITIIVSEETGAISVAYRGALHRDLSGAELTSCLEKLVMSHQDDDDLAETVRMFEDQPTLGPVQTPVPEQKIKEEKE
ncbi:MAG: diadenylate cyclase CdaA [Lentisphaeria bacterium]|nr:diadenylate cyclase CdaA [Lentisphaeria bacterium]MBQ8754630.1 diadenylate cyclase CdaA [Lentisphaeria bacterium]MBQ9776142.1 diadenylate cyclase CdaA [Lentisphaeria bacterium]